MENTDLARTLIRTRLAERTAKNPRYSLRAFATAAGVSHTVLSLFLTGKRPLSRKSAARLAAFLDLSSEERESLFGATLRGVAAKPTENAAFHLLSLDQFAVIKDWYHYAILSALELPDASLTGAWISRVLSISKAEADLAIERLLKLGLLKRLRTGRWAQATPKLRVQSDRLHEASRSYYRSLLTQAAAAIDDRPREQRRYHSMTFVADADSLAYADERIRRFQQELCQDLEARAKRAKTNPSSEGKAVFTLATQLFPVSRFVRPEKKHKEYP